MLRLSAALIDLSDSEREALEQLMNRNRTEQQIALRAKIILRAANRETHGEIANALGVSHEMSRVGNVENHPEVLRGVQVGLVELQID